MRAARERLEKLIASVLARKGRVEGEFYAMGLELRELAVPANVRLLGYGTFKEMLLARRVMAPVTAMKLITVAEAYPQALAASLGLEKAYALVRYVAATPAADVARELAAGNARIGGKTVGEMGVREINALTRRLRTGERPVEPKDPAGKAARKVAGSLQRALRKAGARQAIARARWDGKRWELRVEMPADEGTAVVGALR